MASLSPAVASPIRRIALFQRLPSQHHSHLMGHVRRTFPISASFYMRSSTSGSYNEPPKFKMQLDYAMKKLSEFVSSTTGSFNESPRFKMQLEKLSEFVSSTTGSFNESTKFKMQLDYAMKKFSEFVPESVHNFPWKKAESYAMQQLLVALKWSLIALFILSSLCDLLYSFTRNEELLIPFGLFFGCLTADFLKETSQEFLPSKEAGMTWHLLGISCFFILVKIIAIYFSDRQSFLLHTANGGLMQVLWRWLSSSQHEVDHGTNVTVEDAAASSNAEN